MDRLGLRYLQSRDNAWLLPFRTGKKDIGVFVVETDKTVLIFSPVVTNPGLELSSTLVKNLLRRNGEIHLGRYVFMDEIGIVFQADALLEGLTCELFRLLLGVVVSEVDQNGAQIQGLAGRGRTPRLF